MNLTSKNALFVAATAWVFPTKLGTANVDGVVGWKTIVLGCTFVLVLIVLLLLAWDNASWKIGEAIGEPEAATAEDGLRQEGSCCWVVGEIDLDALNWFGRMGDKGDKESIMEGIKQSKSMRF